MNWINRNYRFCLLFIVSFITLFSIDILFRMFVFEMPNILTLIRIYLFDTAAALLITLVCGILPEF